MHGFGKATRSGLVIAIALSALPSCRRPGEAVKSDLHEAGYQLTAADWMKASRSNDVAALKKFVAGGFSTDTRDDMGNSALHAAAAAGARDSADFLMDRGMSVDIRGAADRTPLMAAVIADQTELVRWLLNQGADPRAKDQEGFSPLMLAVREGKSGPAAELAPYQRENLDSAILLAALVGGTEVIDTLTNYGASVYARMEDGRTPLMIAAQNGHADSVKLLIDIGASRFSTDNAGQTAADLANSGGHAEIAAMISRDPLPGELALQSPAEVAKSMDILVDAAVKEASADPLATETPTSGSVADDSGLAQTQRPPAMPIQNEVLSASSSGGTRPAGDAAAKGPTTQEAFPLPPLVMRYYRERELPVQVSTVEGGTATLSIRAASRRELKVRPGENIPGSRLTVVRVQRRMQDSKLNLGQPMEVSVVEVRDTVTGATREWISGVPTSAHDPVALVEDSATGKRYTASPGQRFKSADGSEFIVSDVRPNQIVIEDAATGAVQTIPLRGPRG